MHARFNKPSPTLIEMRSGTRSLMTAHRFEEAVTMAEEIRRREIVETEEAARKMSSAYQQAGERLRQQYELERDALTTAYESKMLGLLKAEATNLRPLSQRIEKFQKIIVDAENSQRRGPSSVTRTPPARKSVLVPPKAEPVALDAKLKLPPLALLGKRPRRMG
jgi:hypothetical protein